SQILPRALPKAYTHVPLGKGGIPKKFGKLGQPAVETRSPNPLPPSSFPILGFACEEVRRQAERPTLADVGDKTGAGRPYAAPGRLRPRMRGESRTKAPLMEKIDLSKSSVSALQYETAMGPPRKFQDQIAPLCPIELLLCLALRWSFSDLLPLVDPGFGLPDLACLVGLRLGLPNLVRLALRFNPRPGSFDRHKVQPPDLVRLIGIRVGLPGLSTGARCSALHGSSLSLMAPPFFSQYPVARIGSSCRGFHSVQLLSWTIHPNLSISWPAPRAQLPRVRVAGLGASFVVCLLSCGWSSPLSGRLVSAEDRRILGVDRRMPGSLLRFRYAICLRLRTSS
ncbi:hypothetical protein U1Q18_009690, partial [Sarracenia purpurea var. burkii]